MLLDIDCPCCSGLATYFWDAQPPALELLSLLEAFLIFTDGMEGMLLAFPSMVGNATTSNPGGETRVAAEHPSMLRTAPSLTSK